MSNEPTPYEVRFSSAAQRDLGRIPPRYATAIVEFVTGVLPTNPQRMGKPLRNELEGLHGARRGDYRVLYEIIEPDHVVLVVRIDHRGRVYKTRRPTIRSGPVQNTVVAPAGSIARDSAD